MSGVFGTFFREDEVVEKGKRGPRFCRHRIVRTSEWDWHICQRIDLRENNRGTGRNRTERRLFRSLTLLELPPRFGVKRYLTWSWIIHGVETDGSLFVFRLLSC